MIKHNLTFFAYKKWSAILAILLTVSISIPLLARSSETNSIIRMIRSDMYDNEEEIRQRAQALSEEERGIIYGATRQKSIKTWVGCGINYLFGFGVGSYIQGDTTGGLIQTVGYVGGFSFLIAGLSQNIGNTTGSPKGGGLVIGGILLLVSSAIFGLVRPFLYASGFNDDLRDMLDYHRNDYPGANRDIFAHTNQDRNTEQVYSMAFTKTIQAW